MKRLELLCKLSAMPEGIEILDAMPASFTGRGQPSAGAARELVAPPDRKA
jgi:hypothetical protein